MDGHFIEKQFQHVSFENEQMRRTLETRRLLEDEQPNQPRRRYSLVDIFGRFAPWIEPRTPVRRSQVLHG